MKNEQQKDLIGYLGNIWTTASAESSLSKLKMTTIYLRNSMEHERLQNLAILSIEHSMGQDFYL